MNEKYQALARACYGHGAREIQRICDDTGVSAIIRVFLGQCKGHTDDMPYVQSTYWFVCVRDAESEA